MNFTFEGFVGRGVLGEGGGFWLGLVCGSWSDVRGGNGEGVEEGVFFAFVVGRLRVVLRICGHGVVVVVCAGWRACVGGGRVRRVRRGVVLRHGIIGGKLLVAGERDIGAGFEELFPELWEGGQSSAGDMGGRSNTLDPSQTFLECSAYCSTMGRMLVVTIRCARLKL